MKERPILFSAPMVRAILDGSKTQTRRIVNQKKNPFFPGTNKVTGKFLYGERGDRLWVRESWRTNSIYDNDKPSLIPDSAPIEYLANTNRGEMAGKSRPSIFMLRWASRINLEITGVRVERLQDISDDDCLAEDIESQFIPTGTNDYVDYYRNYLGSQKEEDGPWFNGDQLASYRSLWQSINSPKSWDANPWVWVVEFKRMVS